MGLPVAKHESERWKVTNGNDAMKFCSTIGHWFLIMQVFFCPEPMDFNALGGSADETFAEAQRYPDGQSIFLPVWSALA